MANKSDARHPGGHKHGARHFYLKEWHKANRSARRWYEGEELETTQDDEQGSWSQRPQTAKDGE